MMQGVLVAEPTKQEKKQAVDRIRRSEAKPLHSVAKRRRRHTHIQSFEVGRSLHNALRICLARCQRRPMLFLGVSRS